MKSAEVQQMTWPQSGISSSGQQLNRMPVRLSPKHSQRWREPNRFQPQFLKILLRPYPAEEMDSCRMAKLVNNARHTTHLIA